MAEIKLRRGIKRSFQVLLDPHKARLLELVADTEDKKATSLMRELAYEYIKENAPVQYEEAEAKDEEIRLKSNQTRVQIRTKNRDKCLSQKRN